VNLLHRFCAWVLRKELTQLRDTLWNIYDHHYRDRGPTGLDDPNRTPPGSQLGSWWRGIRQLDRLIDGPDAPAERCGVCGGRDHVQDSNYLCPVKTWF